MAMNIYLPVLPLIADDLNISAALAQYTLTLFLAATALAQLLIGPFADRYGRRPVLLASAALYFVGSVVCVLATTIEVLLAGRLLQAASAASMSLSRAIIRDMVDREQAASMIGYVTMAMTIIPMMSPAVGGLVGEIFGWRAPFVVLLVISFLTIILIYTTLGETHQPQNTSFRQQASAYGQLLREPMAWGYFMVSSLNSGAYFTFLAGAPFVAQHIIGMSPAHMGLYFGFLGIGYMCGNFLSGRYSQRIGIENMMFWGGVVASIGIALAFVLMLNEMPHPLYLFLPMTALGIGNGLTLPNSTAGGISVRPDLAGSASGIGAFLQIGGGALLATLSGTLISVDNNAIPLYVIMFASTFVGTLLAGYMLHLARRTS